MKLFERTGGYFLFWLSAIYLTVGLTNIFTGKPIPEEVLHPLWILTLASPFIIPPFGRWLNMSIDWDRKMFDFFRFKKNVETTNVVKFPEPKETPKMPYIVPPEPKKEEPAKIYYRLGLTDNNRVAFSMGMSEVTMNHEGCQQMIDQLVFFQSQLREETNDSES